MINLPTWIEIAIRGTNGNSFGTMRLSEHSSLPLSVEFRSTTMVIKVIEKAHDKITLNIEQHFLFSVKTFILRHILQTLSKEIINTCVFETE